MPGGLSEPPPLYIFVDLFFIYQDINLKLSVNSYFFVSDQMKVVSKTSDPYKGQNRGVKVGGVKIFLQFLSKIEKKSYKI